MAVSNNEVKTALIIMYLIGIICLGITFFVLKKVNGQFFTKFSIGLISVIFVMGIILTELYQL
ncbi:hypothetical protein [Lentilactobacillus laojiaonis]|uniref:hypothetical protein n=1 Tax=Lentilactobacillus laojiaonis TaxID=2883998 RepID=UPI001D0AC8EC|nr:hypothetical protein [Lentilactobacillus laojiaonis]UDM32199.1 hypothetical protein LHL71_00210 [Lentilactobacillus laojiaonis]